MAGNAVIVRKSVRVVFGCRFSSQVQLIKDGRGGAERGEFHVPVLIVGAGPVGLVLSFFLSKFGILLMIIYI